eukprot:5649251-Prymnesium_polylepis.2
MPPRVCKAASRRRSLAALSWRGSTSIGRWAAAQRAPVFPPSPSAPHTGNGWGGVACTALAARGSLSGFPKGPAAHRTPRVVARRDG